MTNIGDKATVRELYQVKDQIIFEMNKKFESLELKLDTITITYALQKDMVDVKKEVQGLQSWKWYVIGFVGALSFMLSLFGDYVKAFIFKH